MTAALEPENWLTALDLMASHSGSSHGQLIGVGGDRDVSFNLVTQFDAAYVEKSMDMGGVRVDLNYRMAASEKQISKGLYDPIVYEKHYAEAIPALSSRLYVDWCEEIGIPFGCQSNLVIDGFGLVGLAVLRNRKYGKTTPKDRVVFAKATEAARRAVRLQERLEGQQAKMLAGAFDAIGICAFLLDRRGRLIAHTASADALFSDGTVRSKAGMLDASGKPMSLHNAIMSLTMSDGGSNHVRLKADLPNDRPALLFEGFRLPSREWSFGHLPHAVVIANPPKGDRAGITSFLITLYRLTPAEADIALRMLDGRSRAQIAAERSVTPETLKGQIKTLYLKCGVDGEAALVRLLADIAS